MSKYNFFESLGFAGKGIMKCIKKERNLKIHLMVAVIVSFFGVYLSISKTDWLVLLLLFAVIFSAEIFNSSIEAICDLLREKLKLDYGETTFIRNASAGAVLILTSFSVIIGFVLFLPYIFK